MLVIAILVAVGVLQVPQLFRAQQAENDQLRAGLDEEARTTRRLQALSDRLTHTLDQLPGLLLATDSKGVIRMLRGQGRQQLGPAADWAVGRSVTEVYSYAPWIRDAVERALLGEQTAAEGVHDGLPVRVVMAPIAEGTRWAGGIVALGLTAGGAGAGDSPAAPAPAPAVDMQRLKQEFLAMASQELRGPVADLGQALRAAAPSAGSGAQPEADPASAAAEADRQYRRLVQRLEELFQVSQPARVEPTRPTVGTGVADLSVLLFGAAERLEAEAVELQAPLLIQAPLPVIGPWDSRALKRLVTGLLSRGMKVGRGRPVEVLLSLHDEVAHMQVRSYGGGLEGNTPDADDLRNIARGFGGELYLGGDGVRGAVATVYLPVAPADAGVELPPEPREVG